MLNIPRATYRIQFHPGFTFLDAAALADYLETLGVSHLYASPYLQAAKGSTHGYDIVDPGRVNEELGGVEAHQRLCASLRNHGMGQILDVVPNHMAITGPENAWWWDVLENGSSSPYAAYFDVDWNPPEERLANKILFPILGDHYGRVIEKGEIRLHHEKGRFCIRYHDHSLPVAPNSLVGILDRTVRISHSDHLGFIADALRHLPVARTHDLAGTRRWRRNWKEIQSLLQRAIEGSPEIPAALDKVLGEVNASADLMDVFLDEQNYRLAYWRSAARDLSYRRFFDINTLMAVRIEDEDVFADTHGLVLSWLRDGTLDGIRIDHPDGLKDPEQYLRRLREKAPEAWIVVEKILHPGEKLPSPWPVQGTTGYDFLNLMGGLFIDPSGEKPLTDFYAEFTGEATDFRMISREKKHQVLHELLASDVNRLTDLMVKICERHRRYRDYSRYEMNEAVRELIACFPVYRTYLREEEKEVGKEDRKVLEQATHTAKLMRPEIESDLFDFLKSLLLLEHRGEIETEFALRFQQLTGPAAAKGVEDTAFYCFNRFIGLNEVGGDPGLFGISLEAFHQGMSEAAKCHPYAMLSTSTHDTKRSEDVRARLALLSEIPERWSEAVRSWSAHNKKHREKHIPDRNEEYLLYQTLVGAWPIDTTRVLAFMQKAAREAKVHTSWTRPDEAYEKALSAFTEKVLTDREFHAMMEAFVSALVEAGRINSLSQVLLKLTAPGAPDFYQGTELWDLSLVDPDNRRPVDFDLRRKLLAHLESLSPEEILERMDEGLPKLLLIHRALELRKRLSEVYLAGDYRPLSALGPKAHHVVAFLRGNKTLTVVPRLVLSLNGDWENTSLEVPEGLWCNQFTGDEIRGGNIAVRDMFTRFPAALFSKE